MPKFIPGSQTSIYAALFVAATIMRGKRMEDFFKRPNGIIGDVDDQQLDLALRLAKRLDTLTKG